MAKTNRPRGKRFENVSDEEIQARWRRLQPMFTKWLVICVISVPCLYLLNHYWQPGQQMATLVGVAFRIAVGGTGLFAFLALMAFIFSRPKRNK